MFASAVSRRSACIAIWAFELAMIRWRELPANAAIRLTPSIAGKGHGCAAGDSDNGCAIRDAIVRKGHIRWEPPAQRAHGDDVRRPK
jgi:hypothetical protein